MYRTQRFSILGLKYHRNILPNNTILSHRNFGIYAKYKEAKKTFKPPAEERNLRSFITWKTNLSAFTILLFSGGVYYYTVKHFMSDGEERLRRMNRM